jgi:hypothetical protein
VVSPIPVGRRLRTLNIMSLVRRRRSGRNCMDGNPHLAGKRSEEENRATFAHRL